MVFMSLTKLRVFCSFCHVLEFFFLHFLPFGNLLEILRIVLSLLGVFLNFPLQS